MSSPSILVRAADRVKFALGNPEMLARHEPNLPIREGEEVVGDMSPDMKALYVANGDGEEKLAGMFAAALRDDKLKLEAPASQMATLAGELFILGHALDTEVQLYFPEAFADGYERSYRKGWKIVRYMSQPEDTARPVGMISTDC